jgi:rhodanese-related sulfurtransferase
MLDFNKGSTPRDLDARDLSAMLASGTALVVDVREPDEFADGHIAGAVNLPLSRFDPSELPAPCDKVIVLNCAGGRRSATALARCAATRSDVNTHLYEGIAGWVSASLPLVSGF